MERRHDQRVGGTPVVILTVRPPATAAIASEAKQSLESIAPMHAPDRFAHNDSNEPGNQRQSDNTSGQDPD
jgi:hypothetical protein